jgi:hypothetical protein
MIEYLCTLNIREFNTTWHIPASTLQVTDPILGEVRRTYRVHVPLPYQLSNDVPVPVVMDYHGLTGSAEWQEQDSHFIGINTLLFLSLQNSYQDQNFQELNLFRTSLGFW